MKKSMNLPDKNRIKLLNYMRIGIIILMMLINCQEVKGAWPLDCKGTDSSGEPACPWKRHRTVEEVSINVVDGAKKPILDQETDSRATFCMQNPAFDLTYQYCSFYAGLDLDYKYDFSALKGDFSLKKLTSGQVYQAAIDVQNLRPKSKIVTMDIEFASPFKAEAERDGLVTILPALVNTTSPANDFSMRYYYEEAQIYAEPYNGRSVLQHCGDKAGCQKISLTYQIAYDHKNQRPFSNQFLFLIKDKRIYLGQNQNYIKSNPILINVTIKQTSADGQTTEKLAQRTLSIEASKVWDSLTPSPFVLYGGLKNAVDVDRKTYSALAVLNLAAFVAAAILFTVVLFRRFTCLANLNMREHMLMFQLLERIKKRDYYQDLAVMDKLKSFMGQKDIDQDIIEKRVIVLDDQAHRKLKLEVDATQMGLLRSEMQASEGDIELQDLSLGERSQLQCFRARLVKELEEYEKNGCHPDKLGQVALVAEPEDRCKDISLNQFFVEDPNEVMINRTPKLNKSPKKTKYGNTLELRRSSHGLSISVTDQDQSLEGRINIEKGEKEKIGQTIMRNFNYEGRAGTLSNASEQTDEDLVLYENNNICMQSERIKKIGMTNYLKGNLDMNNESIESFDDQHVASVNERFEKTVKKRVLTNIESQDTIQHVGRGLRRSQMSERVNDAFHLKKQLKKNNDRLKYNNLQIFKGQNYKSRKNYRTSLNSDKDGRLNRTLEEEEDDSNADDVTKEYLTADRKSRTRNLDQRAARSAIEVEYQSFLRQFNEYKLNQNKDDDKLSKQSFTFARKSLRMAHPKAIFDEEDLSPSKTRGNLSAAMDEKEREEYIKKQSVDVFMDFLRRDDDENMAVDSNEMTEGSFNLPQHLKRLAHTFKQKINELSTIGGKSSVEVDQPKKKGKKKKTRAKFPADCKMSKRERAALRDKILLDKMLKEISGLSAFAFGKLDQIDKKALQNWFVNYKHLARVNKENPKQTDKQGIQNMAKIVDLYKQYGDPTSVIVNPVENNNILHVRNREFENKRIEKQMSKIVQQHGKSLRDDKSDIHSVQQSIQQQIGKSVQTLRAASASQSVMNIVNQNLLKKLHQAVDETRSGHSKCKGNISRTLVSKPRRSFARGNASKQSRGASSTNKSAQFTSLGAQMIHSSRGKNETPNTIQSPPMRENVQDSPDTKRYSSQCLATRAIKLEMTTQSENYLTSQERGSRIMQQPQNTATKAPLVPGTKQLTAQASGGSRSSNRFPISKSGSEERQYVSKRLTERLKLVQEETQENFDSPEKEDLESSVPAIQLVELAAEQLLEGQGMSRQSSREFCGLGGVQLPKQLKIQLKPVQKHSEGVISGNTRYKSDANKGSEIITKASQNQMEEASSSNHLGFFHNVTGQTGMSTQIQTNQKSGIAFNNQLLPPKRKDSMFNSVVHENSQKLTDRKRRMEVHQPTVEFIDDIPSVVANSVTGLPSRAQHFNHYNNNYIRRDTFTSDQQRLKGRAHIETMDVEESCNMNPLSDEEQHVIPEDMLIDDKTLGDPHKQKKQMFHISKFDDNNAPPSIPNELEQYQAMNNMDTIDHSQP